MKIVQPYANIIRPTDGINCLRFIEKMARISHASEAMQKLDSWQRFIPAVVIQHGDWSVVEHAYATVLFKVNRGITHELVRHRLFGFTQSSTRFINYMNSEHEPEYIPSVEVRLEDLEEWCADLKNAHSLYVKWSSRKYPPQVARDFIPNALASVIGVTGNLRNWRHALIMRTTKETHPDFRRVMIPLLEEFQKLIPILYEDIEPMQKQSEAIKKAR